MLIPQTNEVDVQNFRGVQSDDINSFVEYVDQEILHNVDDTPEDEDDDTPRNYGFVQIDSYHNIYFAEVSFNYDWPISKTSFPNFVAGQILVVSFDVAAPPPKI